MELSGGQITTRGGRRAHSAKEHLLAVVALLLALAPLAISAELQSDDPVDVLRKAVLQRDYGRWWDVLTDDSRHGRSRDEFIRYQEKMTAQALRILKGRHGVPFRIRVRDFCAWSGIDRKHFQGRYRMEFHSMVHLADKSWVYVTTFHFKLSVAGEKLSLTYTEFETQLKLAPPRVTL